MAGNITAKMRMSGTRAGMVFFDSNILLYADDKRFPEKQQLAEQLIRSHRKNNTGVVSLQVLQEFYSNATRKLKLDPFIARLKVDIFSRFRLVEPNLSDVLMAVQLSQTSRINYWDAMIVHCARKSGCSSVLTEDLNHGQVVDGVRIVNPFL
jgi:predicted nucleic acid-binding protein